jgi:hypothetical protein
MAIANRKWIYLEASREIGSQRVSTESRVIRALGLKPLYVCSGSYSHVHSRAITLPQIFLFHVAYYNRGFCLLSRRGGAIGRCFLLH